MPDSFSSEETRELLHRYGSKSHSEDLTYGTVEDFCDSTDHLPYLSHLQGDLKDLQRPATFKAILGSLPPGSSILEIGAGEPYVAQRLWALGYDVTIVDPYDGSGNGPTEFDHYVAKYPNLRILRALFNEDVKELEPSAFDGIYSISVLEHVHQPGLSSLFRGISRFLKPGGYSIHVIDHVLAGEGGEFHLRQLAEILTLQSNFAGEPGAQSAVDLATLLDKLTKDVDTYYLSAAAHNRWRGTTPYERFRFRKVVSVHSRKTKISRRD